MWVAWSIIEFIPNCGITLKQAGEIVWRRKLRYLKTNKYIYVRMILFIWMRATDSKSSECSLSLLSKRILWRLVYYYYFPKTWALMFWTAGEKKRPKRNNDNNELLSINPCLPDIQFSFFLLLYLIWTLLISLNNR